MFQDIDAVYVTAGAERAAAIERATHLGPLVSAAPRLALAGAAEPGVPRSAVGRLVRAIRCRAHGSSRHGTGVRPVVGR